MALQNAHEEAHVSSGIRAHQLRKFAALSGGFWRVQKSWLAWALSLALIAALSINVLVQLLFNMWNGWFFNALENKDTATLTDAALAFIALVIVTAGVGVMVVLARETLQVRWREWLTTHLMSLWLKHKRYVHGAQEPANPEYRIADDVRLALEPIVDFAVGLFGALLGALTFVSILWSVGGSWETKEGLSIPAYLVWAALLHGMLASGLMLYVGRSLPSKVGHRNEAEAKLRCSLTSLKHENGHQWNYAAWQNRSSGLNQLYKRVVERWLLVVRTNARLTWITNGNGILNPVVPLLLTVPKYLAGDLSLGDVTQIAAAYVHVQVALSWFVDNYRRVAECYASCERVLVLADAINPHEELSPEADLVPTMQTTPLTP